MYCRNPNCPEPHDIIENPISDYDGYEYTWDRQLCKICRTNDQMSSEDVTILTGGV